MEVKKRVRVSLNVILHAKLKEMASEKGVTIPAVIAMLYDGVAMGGNKTINKGGTRSAEESLTKSGNSALDILKNQKAMEKKQAKQRFDKLYGEGS